MENQGQEALVPWLNAAVFEAQRTVPRDSSGRLLGRMPGVSVLVTLPPLVQAVCVQARELAEVWGAQRPPATIVVHLPWDAIESGHLHAAGFTPDWCPEGPYMGEQDWVWRREVQPPPVRRFALVRDEDKTGVSGVGKVANGVLFPDGATVLRWCTSTRSTAVYETFGDMLRIHGHGGATRVAFTE